MRMCQGTGAFMPGCCGEPGRCMTACARVKRRGAVVKFLAQEVVARLQVALDRAFFARFPVFRGRYTRHQARHNRQPWQHR